MPGGVQPREWCGQIPEWRSRISGAPIRRPAGPATGAWKERLMAAVNETIEQVESVTREKYKYGFVTSIEQETAPKDRKSVVSGKSVSVRVDLGGRRIIKKKTTKRKNKQRNI